MPYTESGLWSACQSILSDHHDRQRGPWQAASANEVADVIEEALEASMAQMNVLRLMMRARSSSALRFLM